MSYRSRLFYQRKLYDLQSTDQLFLSAVKENITFHMAKCPEYADLMKKYGFKPTQLRRIDDISKIPVLPTLFLKSHDLFSIQESKLMFKATSSGTNGNPSKMGLDFYTTWLALQMVLRTFSFHKLFSIRPTNYIVLGYQPSRHNKMGATKTAFGATLLAPPLHREYALRDTGEAYEINLEGVITALQRYEKAKHPVRLIGFPAFLLFLLEALEESDIRLKLHPRSMIFTAGGWKRFFFQKADRNELYQRAVKTLGISEANCHDFFGSVEHPVLYCDCTHHHFHIPLYSRIIIRDPVTLKPLPFGEPGLLNLITPLMGSMPYTSIMTDDLAILNEEDLCGCEIGSPWFEILGRVGLENIKTCAVGAGDLTKEVLL